MSNSLIFADFSDTWDFHNLWKTFWPFIPSHNNMKHSDVHRNTQSSFSNSFIKCTFEKKEITVVGHIAKTLLFFRYAWQIFMWAFWFAFPKHSCITIFINKWDIIHTWVNNWSHSVYWPLYSSDLPAIVNLSISISHLPTLNIYRVITGFVSDQWCCKDIELLV